MYSWSRADASTQSSADHGWHTATVAPAGDAGSAVLITLSEPRAAGASIEGFCDGLRRPRRGAHAPGRGCVRDRGGLAGGASGAGARHIGPVRAARIGV